MVFEDRGQPPGAGIDPRGIFVAFEMGDDLGVANFAAQRVGQQRIQSIAHLDALSPLVGRDQKQHAVVRFALPDAPQPKQFVGVCVDRLPLKRRHGHDDQLRGRFSFDVVGQGLQRLAVGRREQPGQIVHSQLGVLRRSDRQEHCDHQQRVCHGASRVAHAHSARVPRRTTASVLIRDVRRDREKMGGTGLEPVTSTV